ncbi:MAG: hypothetical protein RDU24_08965 [Humidesulfovibrio sp.]|uniref:hypothetical protein n=1 Tax=Humidesulfovibrio sp. TaxID=2910988 RepID=UPI0027E727FB|nr:hypothetical protein [Humidesulfovibrio sp.]MDQ7835499.1 hypothetical protein [Humidesulfovibrio sp.]
MHAEKKGGARSTRLRPSVESMVQDAMRVTGLSRPDLYEFALIRSCAFAQKYPATARFILVSHGSQ